MTTEGFRDILEIRRENRYDDRDLTPVFPPPLVPRRLRHEVRERCLADGAVHVPLDEVAARLTLAALGQMNVETIAISLLHSPVNAAHEKRLAEIAEEVVPHIPVSLSNEVQPEKREYERTSTTVANAYVQPQVRSYLDTLSANLADQGHGMPVYIMQSNGGFATPAETRLFPVRMIESGPAAGAIAAASFGRNVGEDAELDELNVGTLVVLAEELLERVVKHPGTAGDEDGDVGEDGEGCFLVRGRHQGEQGGLETLVHLLLNRVHALGEAEEAFHRVHRHRAVGHAEAPVQEVHDVEGLLLARWAIPRD